MQRTRHALECALEHLGATLVFLIDWNKARKCLRHFVSKEATSEILEWAAEHEVGHRAFLEVGGDALIADLLGSVSESNRQLLCLAERRDRRGGRRGIPARVHAYFK